MKPELDSRAERSGQMRAIAETIVAKVEPFMPGDTLEQYECSVWPHRSTCNWGREDRRQGLWGRIGLPKYPCSRWCQENLDHDGAQYCHVGPGSSLRVRPDISNEMAMASKRALLLVLIRRRAALSACHCIGALPVDVCMLIHGSVNRLTSML
jgi:hypothetical protein